MQNEPLAYRTAIVASIGAIINLVVAFGVELTAEQVTAITTTTAVLSGLVIVVWTRGAVTPVANPKDSAGNPLLQVDAVEYADYIGEAGDEEEEEVVSEGQEAQG